MDDPIGRVLGLPPCGIFWAKLSGLEKRPEEAKVLNFLFPLPYERCALVGEGAVCCLVGLDFLVKHVCVVWCMVCGVCVFVCVCVFVVASQI
jgi:hypothetical protein